MKRLYIFWCVVLSAVGIAGVVAQSDRDLLADIEVTIEIDWSASVLNISLQQPVALEPRSQPAQAYYQTQRFNRLLPLIIEESLAHITYNRDVSAHTRLRSDPRATEALERMAQSAVLISSQYDPSFQNVVAKWRLDLARDIASYFVLHRGPRTLPTSYNWVAADDYSGILIIARDELAIRGASGTQRVRPALSPRVYDEQLRVIIDSQSVAPEVIRSVGALLYARGNDTERIRERVGNNPLVIIAKELTGVRYTDIIVSSTDTERILSRRNNRSLVAQGKIAIVINGVREETRLTLSR